MGESRQELLHWLNSLLQLNITKVEQCGTGAAFCQIFDSIYLDLPMARVKFNVNSEYAYIQNFKVLQNCFVRHALDRTVPVEALVKCKMQDNLEFLQWSKRHWDQYFPGHDYDPIARRKASGAPASAAAPVASSSRTSTSSASNPPRKTAASTTPRAAAPRVGATAGGPSAAVSHLKSENDTLKETVAGLEKERDFYFSKLRDIEVLIQAAIEQDPELEKEDGGLVKQIQNVLYATEDGFEIPAEADGVAGEEGLNGDGAEMETF